MAIPRDSVEMSKLHPAYVAGFIDGEWCIRITKEYPKKRSVHYKLEVIVVNNDQDILVKLQQQYGGNVRPHVFKNRVSYYWCIYGHPATALLKEIRSYLEVKAEQADVGLEFQRMKTLGQGGPGKWLSSDELALRDGYYQRIKELKSTKPVTTTKGHLTEMMV